MKRAFDILASALGLLLTAPVMAVLGVWVVLDSRGGIFYRQTRVGLHGRTFRMLKLRSMDPRRAPAEQREITIGDKDPRITRPGRFIRRTKLDELPQLWNVLTGEMSIVGPRPEVPRYVDMYTPAQREVLKVRPGLTDPASIEAFDEPALLAAASDPERCYVEEIMPRKIEAQLAYARQANFRTDIGVILNTLGRIVKGDR